VASNATLKTPISGATRAARDRQPEPRSDAHAAGMEPPARGGELAAMARASLAALRPLHPGGNVMARMSVLGAVSGRP
jgi:hypothetical protein